MRIWIQTVTTVIILLSPAVGFSGELSKKPDSDVLNAVLQDLLTYNGEDSPVRAYDKPPATLRFSPVVAEGAETLDKSADGTYVLKKEGGVWSVLLRQFVFYV